MVIPISKLQKDREEMIAKDRALLEKLIDEQITQAGSNYSKWPISACIPGHLVELARTLVEIYNNAGWQTRVQYISEHIDHWVEFQLFPQGYNMPDYEKSKVAKKPSLGNIQKL